MTGHDELLGRLLLDDGVVTAEALRDAGEEQQRSGRDLGDILLRKGVVDETQLARALAAQMDIPFEPPPLRPEPPALARIDAGLARRKGVLPLRVEGRRLTVAMANALDTDTLDDLRFQSGCHVDPVVAPVSEVERAVAEAYGGELPELLDSLDRVAPDTTGVSQVLEREASAAPIVRIVDHLLTTAIDSRASDIHIETRGTGSRVRLRIDGLLATAMDLPPGSHQAAISRIKIMAGLDISVRRRPQDGGFTLRRRNTELTVRVSTIPTEGGEKAVLRLLDPGDAPRDLGSLGLATSDLERLRRLLDRGQGVLLAAGPTGSGKTTTLSGAVAELAAGKVNIVTLEDPVEYRFPGVAQMEIDRKAGVTFPSGLRAILRQDPDVILVGEVRDRETAEIAMSAAVTGHLVLTTIHTVDAPSAIVRLLEMGVPPFLVAGGLAGVVAQRLVRRVCSRCGGRGGRGRGNGVFRGGGCGGGGGGGGGGTARSVATATGGAAASSRSWWSTTRSEPRSPPGRPSTPCARWPARAAWDRWPATRCARSPKTSQLRTRRAASSRSPGAPQSTARDASPPCRRPPRAAPCAAAPSAGRALAASPWTDAGAIVRLACGPFRHRRSNPAPHRIPCRRGPLSTVCPHGGKTTPGTPPCGW